MNAGGIEERFLLEDVVAFSGIEERFLLEDVVAFSGIEERFLLEDVVAFRVDNIFPALICPGINLGNVRIGLGLSARSRSVLFWRLRFWHYL